MSQAIHTFKTIPQTTFRRLRNTPSYIFLVWRWGTWLYALVWIIARRPYLDPPQVNTAIILLLVTFIQSLVVTLYAPVLQIFLPDFLRFNRRPRDERRTHQLTTKPQRARQIRRPQPLAADEEAEIAPPMARSRNLYRDLVVYGLDVVICGLVIYFSGPFGRPPFGASSPFYRYGLSTIFVAAFAYHYRGGLLAACGYELFVLFGAYFPPPGTIPFTIQLQDLAGAVVDAPLIAILSAFLATLLESYTRSKRREQDNVRRQRAFMRVSETLVTGAHDRQKLLRQSAEQIRRGGHFERLIVALLTNNESGEERRQAEINTYIEAGLEASLVEDISSDESETFIEQVGQAGEKLVSFEPLDRGTASDGYGLARLYIPFFKDGQVYLILGAESVRQTPFETKHDEFLSIVGPQLLVTLENMRLTEQTAELAASAERGRIAREMHDGVAQLVYMLSLNTETCSALAHRLADATPEDAQTLAPLTDRLDKLVTISKQALWETRLYMFTLKPLISGSTTLTEMLTNQAREFETISGLPARLEVEGEEQGTHGDQRLSRKRAQVGTAIFRITQEALTNAYKHAGASQVLVRLHYLPRAIEVEIRDDGKGLNLLPPSDDLTATSERQRIYSGHGLRGMRERAEELDGTFDVRQLPEGGACVYTCIPV
ncbi:MAG: ATP-binding protein [Ktedonobacteraceae bacterium]